MQKRIKLKQQLLVAGCTAMVLTSSGCRSAMPKWNLFAGRNTPSAETLAGNGPTITYPTPPSDGATPTSIASVAGGTAGPTTRSSIANTGPSTNKAAARANGFNLASNRTPPSDMPDYASGSAVQKTTNSSVPAVPAGYQFGGRTSASATTPGGFEMPASYPSPPATSTPKPSNPTAGNHPLANMPIDQSSATASAYGLPQGVAPAAESLPPAGTSGGGFELPAGAIPAPPTQPTVPSLAMPGGPMPAAASTASNAQPFTPKATNSFELPKTSVSPKAGSTPAMPASSGGQKSSFSPASAQISSRASSPSTSPSTSYAPGSTSAATGYPATSGYPSTGTEGSFYR